MAGNYAEMSHADLLRLRNSLAPDDPLQAELAPYEHAAFAREWTEENPVVAVPSLAVSIPGYSLAKLMGMGHSRTPASLAEVTQGYRGIGRGLASLLRKPHS